MEKYYLKIYHGEHTLKLFYSAIIFLASSVFAFNDGVVINGRIIDEGTKEPLVGATVIINGKVEAATSITGFFEIDNIKPGKHILKARYAGYYTEQETLEVAEDTTHIVLKLESKPFQNPEEPRITLKEKGVKYSINAYLQAGISDSLDITTNFPSLLLKFKHFTKMNLTDSKKDNLYFEFLFNSIDEFISWKEINEVKKFLNYLNDISNKRLTKRMEILKADKLPTVIVNPKARIKFTIRYNKRIGTKNSNILFAGFIERINKGPNIHSIKINQGPRGIQSFAKFIFPSIQDFLNWHQSKETQDNFTWMEKDISEDDRIEYKFDVDFLKN